MFGCEKEISEHSHYAGSWIFIRSDSLVSRENRMEKKEDEEIKKKIQRRIATAYSDIKREITFVSY